MGAHAQLRGRTAAKPPPNQTCLWPDCERIATHVRKAVADLRVGDEIGRKVLELGLCCQHAADYDYARELEPEIRQVFGEFCR